MLITGLLFAGLATASRFAEDMERSEAAREVANSPAVTNESSARDTAGTMSANTQVIYWQVLFDLKIYTNKC